MSSRPPENKLLVDPDAEPRKLNPTCHFSSTPLLSNNNYYALTICPGKAQANTCNKHNLYLQFTDQEAKAYKLKQLAQDSSYSLAKSG